MTDKMLQYENKKNRIYFKKVYFPLICSSGEKRLVQIFCLDREKKLTSLHIFFVLETDQNGIFTSAD